MRVELLLLLSVAARRAHARYGPDPPGLPDTKCAWRSLALEYAVKLRPNDGGTVKAALMVGAPETARGQWCQLELEPSEARSPRHPHQ